MEVNAKKIEKVLGEILRLLKKARMTRGELVILFGQLLVQVGYSIYFQLERPDASPPGHINGEEARALLKKDPTLGSMLMQLGCDFQGGLLRSLEEAEERKK